MNEQEIVQRWNRGDFKYVTDFFSADELSNNYFLFYFIDCYLQQDLIEEAKVLIDKFFQDKQLKPEETIIEKLLRARLASRLGNISQIEFFLNKISEVDLPNNQWLEYNTKQLQALVFFMNNDYSRAKSILLSLETQPQELQTKFDNLNISYYYLLKCLINLKLGEKKEALSNIVISEALNSKFDYKAALAHDYLMRGQIYIELGEFLKGLTNFERAKMLYVEYNDARGKNLVNNAVAEVKFIQGRLNEALDLFEVVKKEFEGNDYYLCDIYVSIGRIEHKKKNYAQAKWNYEKAIEHAQNQNLLLYKSVAIVNLVDLFLEEGDIESIKKYKNMLNQDSDDKTIQAMKLMIEALLKQAEGSNYEAKKIWSFITGNSSLPIYFQLFSLENALKTSILLWKNNKELDILNEIEKLLEVWEKLAQDNFLMSSLATINLLKAKFYIAILQVEEAKKFLQDGLEIAEKYDLQVDKKDIENDKEKIIKLEELEHTTGTSKGETKIELDVLLDYLKNVKTNILVEKS